MIIKKIVAWECQECYNIHKTKKEAEECHIEDKTVSCQKCGKHPNVKKCVVKCDDMTTNYVCENCQHNKIIYVKWCEGWYKVVGWGLVIISAIVLILRILGFIGT